MLDWQGKLPTRPRYFFGAADTTFFERFARALAMSADKMGNPLHMHVINPSSRAFAMANRINAMPTVSVTWAADERFSEFEGQSRSTYYSNVRTFALPHLLRMPGTERVVVIDFDSLFNRPYGLYADTKPIGLFLRDTWQVKPPTAEQIAQMKAIGRDTWVDMPTDEKRRLTMTLGSMWWVDASHVDYAQACADYVTKQGFTWMIEQAALYEVMHAMGLRDSVSDIALFIPPALDWRFSREGMLWTGKGPRKLERNPFSDRVSELNAEFGAANA